MNGDGSIAPLSDILRDFKPPATTGTCADCGEGVYHGAKECPACEERQQQRLAIRGRALRAAAATIPGSFAFTRAGFDDATVRGRVRDPAALERVRAGASGSASMLFRGEAGLGKTVSAAAVAWARAGQGLAPLWVDAFELANAVARSALGREPQLVAEALAAPVLVLDDLGSETAIATSPIAEVLHRRHARGLASLVTTWCDDATLRERYGDGIVRRLRERAVVVNFNAPRSAVR